MYTYYQGVFLQVYTYYQGVFLERFPLILRTVCRRGSEELFPRPRAKAGKRRPTADVSRFISIFSATKVRSSQEPNPYLEVRMLTKMF